MEEGGVIMYSNTISNMCNVYLFTSNINHFMKDHKHTHYNRCSHWLWQILTLWLQGKSAVKEKEQAITDNKITFSQNKNNYLIALPESWPHNPKWKILRLFNWNMFLEDLIVLYGSQIHLLFYSITHLNK